MHASPFNRSVLCSLLLLAILPARAFAGWPEREYKEVRGYAFNPDGGPDTIIRDGRLNASTLNPDGVLLTKAQVQRLIAALSGPHQEHPLAACFNPRHAFVFYDESRRTVAVVDICFECLGAQAYPEGCAAPYDFPALAELCAELKLSGAPDAGFRAWFDDFRRSFPQELSAPPAEQSRRKRRIR